MCGSQQYRLRWDDHKSNFINVFEEYFNNSALTDCTLTVGDGISISCHKMVLVACSDFFRNVFMSNPPQNPSTIVLLNVQYSDMRAILEYMYKGEVNVAQEHLSGLMKLAEFLKVRLRSFIFQFF